MIMIVTSTVLCNDDLLNQKRRRLLLAEDLETDTLDRFERLLARGRGRLAKRHLGNELPR